MTDFLVYLLAFALVLGVLVFAHELGHFLVARLLGVKVLRFSLGFGRALWSKPFGRDRTELAIGVFPLGGYVKMLDEREGEVMPDELPRAFNRQRVGSRMAIVAAGPIANLLLAVLLNWGVFWYGTEEIRPLLGTPVVASAAERAGIENGERVVRIAGEVVQTWQEMRWVLLNHAVDQDTVEIEVANQRNEISVRHLDVSSARANGWEGDALEKLGLTLFRPRIPPVIGSITEQSVAETAGLQVGDEIVRIDDAAISSWQEVVRVIGDSPDRMLRFEVRREGETFVVRMAPRRVEEDGRVLGRIGIGVKPAGFSRDDLMIRVRYAPVSALGKALIETWEKSIFSLRMIGKMIVGEISWHNISGPLTIADYAGQSAKLGVDYYLKFMALVSISLAVLNLLPVPILDGGHLLYYVLEVIRRRPLSERAMEFGQQIGLALLLMLMAFAFYNDVNRLISG